MLEAQAQFDLAISKGQGSSDFAEIAIGKIAVGLAEMRRVGGVVGLQAKFGFDFFGDCEIFEQRQVNIGKTGPSRILRPEVPGRVNTVLLSGKVMVDGSAKEA